MEYQMVCPHCGKTISNDSMIDSTGNRAGLASTFIYYQCGEKVTFSAFITQLRDQNNLQQDSNSDIIYFPWLEVRTGLP